MKRLLVKAYGWLVLFGLDPLQTLSSIKGLPYYFRDLRILKQQQKSTVRNFPLGTPFLCLQERSTASGSARGHYFHQDLLVARRIYLTNPIVHVDVGSRVDGFVAHVASFRAIRVFDIRPQAVTVPNIHFVQADLMAPVDGKVQKAAIRSRVCMRLSILAWEDMATP